ncbi:DUF1289 domain-containing protein [Paraburkholderia strydomiana]|uniref:DUF1289 domain-containing protein n=1 Tax=Paraburkholderia strydomiana TaxID=1245417 RepID=A0ABW9BXS9_9BURK
MDMRAFDGRTGLCVGCLRTLDGIRAWKKMTDHRRHQVIPSMSGWHSPSRAVARCGGSATE